MPLVYRAMQPDGDGPMIGHVSNDTLGVRERLARENGLVVGDVRPENGLIQPGTGGMSVAPSKEDLPPHLIPKRKRKEGYPAAKRSNTLPETFPWRMGAGQFADGPLCTRLQLRIDESDPAHGLVEPDMPMPLQEYRSAIEDTRPKWVREQW
jgi:hypothetical protein